MKWDQVSGEKNQQVLETQQSYETEWDMVNTVSFKKRPCSNTECEFSALYNSVSKIFTVPLKIIWCFSRIQSLV